jgi:hypothetical protein
MTQRTKDIIEKIQTFKEDEKLEIISYLLQKSLSNRLQMIQLDNNILFVLNKKKHVNSKKNYSQRSTLSQSISNIQKYNMFGSVVDPVLWQKQMRDDR